MLSTEFHLILSNTCHAGPGSRRRRPSLPDPLRVFPHRPRQGAHNAVTCYLLPVRTMFTPHYLGAADAGAAACPGRGAVLPAARLPRAAADGAR